MYRTEILVIKAVLFGPEQLVLPPALKSKYSIHNVSESICVK